MASGAISGLCGYVGRLAAANGLSVKRFVFQPGMLFGSMEKWWGQGRRRERHNGLDLREFEFNNGRKGVFGGGRSVPAVHDGVAVKTEKDFLGQTVFLAHDFLEEGKRLYTIYGHMAPVALAAGERVRVGAILGRVAEYEGMKVPAHLHLSVALIPPAVRPQELTWEFLLKAEGVVFLDPAGVL